MPVPGNVRTGDWVPVLELNISPAIYASGDLLADVVEVPDACEINGSSILESAVVIDYGDQGGALTLVFFDANPGSLGVINGAMAINNAQAAMGCGHIAIIASDYTDLGTQQMATKAGCGLEMRPADGGTSLWMAIKSMDAKTYPSARLTVKLGFLRG